jgi:hypothetical protein
LFYWQHRHLISICTLVLSRTYMFFFQALNFLVECFELLNDLFPFHSILEAGYTVFLIFIWQMPCLMLSSHLYLGFPCDLLVRGFQLNIFLTVLVSGILCTWPNQLSLWSLMWLIIFLCFISLSNSSLILTLHICFSFWVQIFILRFSSQRLIISELWLLSHTYIYVLIF